MAGSPSGSPERCGEPRAPSTRWAVPAGGGRWSGRHYTPVARGSLSQFRSWDPPSQPGPGGAHKAPLFLPWNEWIGGSRDRLSAGDTGDPVGQAEGRGTGGGTERRTDRADTGIAGSGETHSCASRGVPHHASPRDGSPGDAHTAPQPQCWLPAGATEPQEWHHRAPAGLARVSWRCCRERGAGRVDPAVGPPAGRSPHGVPGEGVAGSRQPRFIPTHGVPTLLSCLTPSSLYRGQKPRKRGRAEPTGDAQPWGHSLGSGQKPVPAI